MLISKIALFVCLTCAVSCKSPSEKIVFTKESIKDYNLYRWNPDSSIIVLSSNMEVPIMPFKLKPGKYIIKFKAEGEPAAGVLPNLSVALGDLYITDKSISTGVNEYAVKFEIQEPMHKPLVLAFTNDYSSATEDRNIYLHVPIAINPY